MDLLDRLLKHDEWTTRQLLLRCQNVADGQLEQAPAKSTQLVELEPGQVIDDIELQIAR